MTVADDHMPCCDYRDHGSGACACPNHARSTLHPFGHLVTCDHQFTPHLLNEDDRPCRNPKDVI